MSSDESLEVELTGPRRREDVPWVRFTVQELLGGFAVGDGLIQGSQRVAEKRPVAILEGRSVFAALDHSKILGDSVCEVRRRDIDLPHAGMPACRRSSAWAYCVRGTSRGAPADLCS